MPTKLCQELEGSAMGPERFESKVTRTSIRSIRRGATWREVA